MLVSTFYYIDEFCKEFEKELAKNSLSLNEKIPDASFKMLRLSEIMTICVLFHTSGYKNFKDYYLKHVSEHMRGDFKKLPAYNRFIERKAEAAFPLALFFKLCCTAKCTGISYIDSFALEVCHNKRIHCHKVFKGFAKRGKTSMGWFFGFKIHFIINENGGIIDFCMTPGNVADNNENVMKKLTQSLSGKLFGDRGYIVKQPLRDYLWANGIQLITRLRSTMKNKFTSLLDKFLLGKRGVIESVIHLLKDILSIEHTRHRSPVNFLTHIFSALVAYAFREKKPSINFANGSFMLAN